ncbi:hypothetical protein AVEN_146329-1, partial [Araneus ventricosus]
MQVYYGNGESKVRDCIVRKIYRLSDARISITGMGNRMFEAAPYGRSTV